MIFIPASLKRFQKKKEKERPRMGVQSSNRRAISPAGWFGRKRQTIMRSYVLRTPSLRLFFPCFEKIGKNNDNRLWHQYQYRNGYRSGIA
ncbi:hypothetical protein [Mucilaginibacter frigoritolerans]|uniref:hypothetical protein n=1 Tax=Mucilaginibacter frigoritolerans TaxID=652788 RepID=UPI0011AA6D80|nr:hypothetical protein [Mucilaginibacter frigoritolerans]